jgi:hypothetical protein
MRTRIGLAFIAGRRALSLAAVAVAVATLVWASFAAAREWTSHPHSAGVAPPAGKTPPAAQVKSNRPRRVVETEVVTLRPTGFEPAEITRPAGEFILMVENATGHPVSLSFSRETGERLHEVRATREQPDWNELEDLQPGRYLLTEADHPEWVCRVTITAR